MNPAKDQWWGMSWSPVTGCSGPDGTPCSFCFARRMANRLRGRCGYPADDPFRPTFHPERLSEPARRKKPARIFVCSMGDLFDPQARSHWRGNVLYVIRDCPQHKFMVLTKQAKRMAEWMAWYGSGRAAMEMPEWPLLNLALGVSVTNQADADVRIPLLLQTPAACRFVSVEPVLNRVDIADMAISARS